MDHGCFDDLTRSVASGGESRRAVLRLLAGATLGAFSGQFDLRTLETQAGSGRAQTWQRQTRQATEGQCSDLVPLSFWLPGGALQHGHGPMRPVHDSLLARRETVLRRSLRAALHERL